MRDMAFTPRLTFTGMGGIYTSLPETPEILPSVDLNLPSLKVGFTIVLVIPTDGTNCKDQI